MMKKLITMIASLLVIVGSLFVFMACNSKNNQGSQDNTVVDSPTDITTSNAIVVYFSCTNTTKNIANKIATSLECRTFEIEPNEPYTNADLNYNNNSCRANREQNDDNARPAIKNQIDNLADYDIIFLGYPIWWGTLPRIIYTFCDTYDLSGKTIVPFCTSGRTGITASVNDLKVLVPNATVLNGRRCNGDSQNTITAWVNSLNLQIKKGEYQMNIYVGTTKLMATMANNSSAKALKELLTEGDITVDMHDYGNFEKVGSLGYTLPRNDKQITTTAGDIILYQGNQITIYYDTNSYNFTKLGKIQNITKNELKSILGNGKVSVRLSLD